MWVWKDKVIVIVQWIHSKFSSVSTLFFSENQIYIYIWMIDWFEKFGKKDYNHKGYIIYSYNDFVVILYLVQDDESVLTKPAGLINPSK